MEAKALQGTMLTTLFNKSCQNDVSFEKMGFNSPKFKLFKIPTIISKYVKSSNKFQNHLLFQTKFNFVQNLANKKPRKKLLKPFGNKKLVIWLFLAKKMFDPNPKPSALSLFLFIVHYCFVVVNDQHLHFQHFQDRTN